MTAPPMIPAPMIPPPLIPVSWGEVFDKLAILTIKAGRLVSADALAHVAREHAALTAAAAGLASASLPELQAALLAVNTRLWRIEDLIRAREAECNFGPHFIALARAVYRENDERARIKQAINRVLRSPLVEQKQYTAYISPP